jgi:hypothetical protein
VAFFLDNMPFGDKGRAFFRSVGNNLADDAELYLRRSKTETSLVEVTLHEDCYCPEALKETTKVLRIIVLPIPNYGGCPLHRGGISDYFRLSFFERKMQDFVLRICRPRMVYADATRSVREVDIHLFVLEGDSALLRHLQSSWWATLMVSLMQVYLLQIRACPAV